MSTAHICVALIHLNPVVMQALLIARRALCGLKTQDLTAAFTVAGGKGCSWRGVLFYLLLSLTVFFTVVWAIVIACCCQGRRTATRKAEEPSDDGREAEAAAQAHSREAPASPARDQFSVAVGLPVAGVSAQLHGPDLESAWGRVLEKQGSSRREMLADLCSSWQPAKQAR